MFKQLLLNITLAEALILMPKYQKMLKALLSNKEKLQELANTPLNENCSAVILKKLLEKLGDPGKFLILCGFSELKCKTLADLEASINLIPLSVWKKLGLPDLIPTRMTLELANRAICTPDGIARDVFVPVGKFTFSTDFVVVDYESNPRVPLILERPFLRTARALIDVHSEEMILRDGNERLTLNIKHDTASYSNHPYRESVNLINIFNLSREDCLEDLVTNMQSGNPTFSLHKEIASPEVIHKIHDSKGCTFLSEEFPDIDSFNDFHSHFDDDPLSGSTTYSANSLLEEFADELALISYPPDYDDNRTCDIESDIREIEFLLYQGEDSDFKDSIDQSDLTNRNDLFVDPTPEMFTHEQPPDYSFPSRFDYYRIYEDSRQWIYYLESSLSPLFNFGITDPRVPLILGKPFLRTACALIDVHGEEMILRDEDERLTLNMKHDTATYSNHPHRDSVNLINFFNLSSEDCLKDLVSHKQSGNPTFSLHKEIASPKVIPEIHDSKGCTFLSEELPDINSFTDIHPYFDDDLLSGSTTYSANSLLEEFADELALISYPPDYDDDRVCDINEDFLEDLFPKQPSGNPTFSPHPELTSPEVNNDRFDSKGCNALSEKLPDLDSTKDLHPPLHDNPLNYDDNLQFDIKSDLKEIFLLYQDKDSSLKDSIDQKDFANLDDIFVDSAPEMFTDEHAPDYSSSPIF
nr:reverse transcriptase domain-containing protein [Tanacetum cinerariifolium]